MEIDHRRKMITDFLADIAEGKPNNQAAWDVFLKTLADVGMKTKAIAIRMAHHYNISRPLHFSDIQKLPPHIRGYGIAGAMDSTKDYEYLENLYTKGQIEFTDLVQAVEGWIAGDPNVLVTSYYKKKTYCPDKWAKQLIETSLWGDSLRAAVKLASIEHRHIEWAINLIRKRPIGDPSNAAVDLLDCNLVVNTNYALEIIYNDKIGCPSSAAQRLRAMKALSNGEFKAIVKSAKSGDPAAAVQNSELANDKEFARNIAEADMTVSAPKLAIWLVNNKEADPKWAYDLLLKSKHAAKIDHLAKEILLDRIHNPAYDEYRQTKRSRVIEGSDCY